MGLIEHDGARGASAVIGRRKGVLLRQIAPSAKSGPISIGIFEHDGGLMARNNVCANDWVVFNVVSRTGIKVAIGFIRYKLTGYSRVHRLIRSRIASWVSPIHPSPRDIGIPSA